jgi:transcriptional regulator with PAS, ATPase and Fis domain
MKLLFSWISQNNDFTGNEVNEQGPTINFHRQFFKYDHHYILSSAEKDDLRLEYLINKLLLLFPERREMVVPVYMKIRDVVSLEEVKPRVEALLLEHRDDDIDIFFSPGTSIMQVCWFICHTTLGLNTRLLQTRAAKFSKDKTTIELTEIKVEQSVTPVTAIIKSQVATRIKSNRDPFLMMPSIEPIYKKAFRIAQAESVSTLIFGASGTGKEHLAKYIHEKSPRGDKPFIPVNCSAMGDSLLESRLFGYKKGAFSGAERDTAGLFDAAEGGTIFLDEIGDISPYMQQSLLRVLQAKEIMPVGGMAKKINVRVISATNKDLRQRCHADQFRWDLYYRLSVTELELPSLFDRGADEKRLLVEHFLLLKKLQFKRQKTLSLSEEAYRSVMDYPFPGNIRELENFIESLYVYHEEMVEISDLPMKIRHPEPAASLRWQDVEMAHIRKVLAHFKGNQRKTCEALGYGSINTLVKKLKLVRSFHDC